MFIRLVILAIIATAVKGQEICSRPEELKKMAIKPNVEQVGQTTIKVMWNDLWPDLNWSECVKELKVKINDKIHPLNSTDAKEFEVDVATCIPNVVTVELAMSSDLVVSSDSSEDIVIYKAPKPRLMYFKNKFVTGNFKAKDTFEITIPKLEEIVENISCGKVKN